MLLKCIEMRMRSVSEVKGMVMPLDIRQWLWIENRVLTEFRAIATLILRLYCRTHKSVSLKEHPRTAELWMYR